MKNLFIIKTEDKPSRLLKFAGKFLFDREEGLDKRSHHAYITNSDEIKDGDYMIISGIKYQVRNVTSNVVLTLTSDASTSANTAAFIQQGPKYIANVALSDNTYTIQRVFGVDRDEKANVSGAASANANAVCHTGWGYPFKWYPETRFLPFPLVD